MGCVGDVYSGCGLVCLVAGMGYGWNFTLWATKEGATTAVCKGYSSLNLRFVDELYGF